MTSIDVRAGRAKTRRPGSEPEKRKSVLFCPVCGHESPVDGSWIVTTEESQQQFRCPECDQIVAVR